MFSYSTGYYVSPPDDQYLKFKNRCSLMFILCNLTHILCTAIFFDKLLQAIFPALKSHVKSVTKTISLYYPF